MLLNYELASAVNLEQAFKRIKHEGIFEYLFYDGFVQTEHDFMQLMYDSVPLLIFDKDYNLLSLVWFRDFKAKTASIHMCYFKQGLKNSLYIGRELLKFMFNNSYLSLESIYGLTPKPWLHATIFAKKVGGQILGEIPGACTLHYKNKKSVAGIISIFNRKEYV